MTRGTKFLANSRCRCGKYDRTDKPYGHMSGKGNLYLKGYCHSCRGMKSLPYTPQQLEMEGEGIKKFFKNVWNKALKPIGKEVGQKILADPLGAFKVASQLGSATASRNPSAIMSAGMQAGKFISGKGVKIGELTTGGALYLYKK